MSRVVPRGQVCDSAPEVADEIIANSPMGVLMTECGPQAHAFKGRSRDARC
ncbi:MAG TPA: hypothetical protein VMU63_06760 [Acidimicrobiales bacterium]|nr:hypothetical protein [Acidimicrobiales bacterium]